MTVALTKVETQVTWRSPTAGAKTVSIPGSIPANKGYDLDISTTLGTGETYTITPTSGTIDGADNFQFADAQCTLSLRSDADNSDWVIRRFCCMSPFDAVFFDGFSVSYIGSGTADTPLLSFSFWIHGYQPLRFQTILSLDETGNVGGYFWWKDLDQIEVLLFSSSFKKVQALLTIPLDNKFHNILGSIDASQSPARAIFYVDETLQEDPFIDDGPWNIHFSDGIAIPDYPTLPGRFNLLGGRGKHDMGDLWWAPGQFIDFSVAANRLKFHAADLSPVSAASLGANGQTPTGTAPAIFLIGGATTFGNNLGTMGALAFTPVIEDSLYGLHTTLPAPATTKGGVRFFGTLQQLVLVDGVNLDSTIIGTDSPIGTFSVRLRLAHLPASGYYQIAFGNQLNRLYDIALHSSGFIRAQFYASNLTTNAIFTQTTIPFPADNQWHHLIMSWNTNAGTMQVAIDRTSAAVIHSGSVGFDVGLSLNQMTNRIGQQFLSGSASPPSPIGNSLIGDAAELFLDWYHSLELTVAVNLDKFDNGGSPVDLGSDGSMPFGVAPYAYLSQQPQTYDAITFYINRAHPNSNNGFGAPGQGDGFTVGVDVPLVAPAPYP